MVDKYDYNKRISLIVPFGYIGIAGGLIISSLSYFSGDIEGTIFGGSLLGSSIGILGIEHLQTYFRMRGDYMRDQVEKLEGIEGKLGEIKVNLEALSQ